MGGGRRRENFNCENLLGRVRVIDPVVVPGDDLGFETSLRSELGRVRGLGRGGYVGQVESLVMAGPLFPCCFSNVIKVFYLKMYNLNTCCDFFVGVFEEEARLFQWLVFSSALCNRSAFCALSFTINT